MPRRRRRSSSERTTAAGRTLLVLFFCAGIAFLGLLGGGEHRRATARHGPDPLGASYFGRDMPRYPGAEEVPAGPSSTVGGTALKMSFFATEDPPHKVARFYANFWRERRLYVTEDVTHQGGVVSAVDGPRARVLQVLLTVQGQQTGVFKSVTTHPFRAVESGKEPPPVPLYPESSAVLTLGSKEDDKRARIHLSVNDGDIEANVAHYSRELRSAGYAPESTKALPGAKHGERVLVYRKEGSEVTVSITPLGEKRTRVHITEVSS